jgi:hypothetical protein
MLLGRFHASMMTPHNKAAPVNAPIAPWFQVEHHRRRVTEQRRWADKGDLNTCNRSIR